MNIHAKLFAVALLVFFAGLGDATAQTGTLFVEGDNVGVGTPTPSAAFEVERSNGSAQVLVEEKSASVANRTLFELRNPGGVRFEFRNTDSGFGWQMSNLSNSFVLSLFGTGGPELQINPNGSASIGPGGVKHFDLDGVGNLTIQGALTQNSSRASKRGFETIDPAEVLQRLVEMPISIWSYKADRAEARHLGPTAEDFYSTFGLGRGNEGIAILDATGVALASVQGLHRQLEDEKEQVTLLREQVDSLQTERDSLQQRIAELERLVQGLVERAADSIRE